MKKTKIFLAMMLVVTLLCGATVLPVAADDVVSGEWGDLSWELNKTTWHLTISGSGEMENFPYSSSMDGWRIHKDSVQSVSIDADVTSLGNYAFYNFQSLASVTFGENSQITDIGSYAFAGCESLVSIEIPDGVTRIGNSSFNGCKLLDGVALPSVLEYVGDSAFTGCEGLIEQVNGVSYVGQWAVACDASATSVALRDGTVGIGECAFAFCSDLESITLSSGLKHVGDFAFLYCESLTGISFPSSMTTIGSSVFSGCTAFSEMEVEPGNAVYHANGNCLIKTADKVLVVGCKASVIPSDGSVTSIGVGAFEECADLAELEIPSSVTRVAASAFSGCTDLISVDEGVGYVDGWVVSCEISATTAVLSGDTVGIADGAFASCKYLEKVQYMGCEAAWDTVAVGSDNENLTQVLEFVGHAVKNWTVLTEATAESEGLREGECICGEKVVEILPKLPPVEGSETKDSSGDDAGNEKEQGRLGAWFYITVGAILVVLAGLAAAWFFLKKKKPEIEEEV